MVDVAFLHSMAWDFASIPYRMLQDPQLHSDGATFDFGSPSGMTDMKSYTDFFSCKYSA